MPFVECKKHHSIVCQLCCEYPLKQLKKKTKHTGYEDMRNKGKK